MNRTEFKRFRALQEENDFLNLILLQTITFLGGRWVVPQVGYLSGTIGITKIECDGQSAVLIEARREGTCHG